jgi:hypothetical protein
MVFSHSIKFITRLKRMACITSVERCSSSVFDIHSDVEFVPPNGQDGIVVEQNDNWTSIKIFSDSGSQPVGENVTAATAEELNRFLINPDVSNIELSDSITLDCSGSSLSRNVTVICGSYALALSGSLTIEDGGLLVVDAGPDATGTLDITQFSVTADGVKAADVSGRVDLVQIRMSFKHISGEPTLSDGLAYEISNDGTQAFIYLKTDSVSTEQVIHDFTQVLSGEKTEDDNLPNALPLQDTVDGILEIKLDNPLITEEIALTIEGGVTLKLTGSVTFDGGLYRFDFAEGSNGRVTVDMTELTINATDAVGKTKSDNIVLWRERNGVDVLFDESNSHLSYVLSGNGNNELRYVQ